MGAECSVPSKAGNPTGEKHRQAKAKQTYQKVASAGSGFVKAVSNDGIRGGFSYVGNGAKKVYSSFKSYAAERTSEIRAIIHKEMCTTNNRISSLLGKVDWNAVKKVVAGGVILGGLATATVLTGGAAAVIAGGALKWCLNRWRNRSSSWWYFKCS